VERALLVFGVIAEKQKLSTMADVPTAVKPLYELLRNTARLRADLRAGQDAPPEAMLNAAQALIATAEARLASESAQGKFAMHVRDASAAAAAPGRSMDGSTPNACMRLHAVLRCGAIPMRGRRRLGSWDAA